MKERPQMRRGSSILTLAFTGVLAFLCSPVSAQQYPQQYPQQHSGGQVDVGIFYEGLAPQGDWVEMPDYGWSWSPRVERGWRPYTRGQWVMTDDGWYWDSDERFGWATYHYGRWVNDQNYGWFWVPGTEWAPAWVSWRHGNGYTGWAPLPPRATWQTHVGLNIGGLDIDAFIGERDYSFVQDRSFVDRGVYQRVLPPAQNVTIINQTTNITNYTVVNNRVVNAGIPVANVEQAVGRPIARARTVDATRVGAPVHAKAGEVAVYRPEVRAAAPNTRPAQGKSVVKGEAPPPVLVARRKAAEQDRQTRGNAPEVTAKDVQERKASVAQPPPTPQADAKAAPQSTPQQRDQAHQEADQRVVKDKAQQTTAAKAQEQQKVDAQAQADKRAKDAQQARDQQQANQKQHNQQQADQQAAKRESDAQAQAQAAKRATDAQQAAAAQHTKDQEQQKANAQVQADKRAADQQARAQQQNDQKQHNQQQADQQAAKRNSDAQAQAQAPKRATDAQQAAATEHAKAQEQQKANAQVQADKRAADQQARAQQQADQKQHNQQQADQQRAKAQEQQKANAQAQADKRAQDQQAKDQQAKDKGKKSPKPSPTPPPAEKQQ
jgi:hypothetical protein